MLHIVVLELVKDELTSCHSMNIDGSPISSLEKNDTRRKAHYCVADGSCKHMKNPQPILQNGKKRGGGRLEI